MVFAFDTNAKTLDRILTYEYYGYPKDFLQQYQTGLMAVTRADVLRVAKRLNPANLSMVIVGNPVIFGQPLEALDGLVNRLDVTIPEPKPKAVKSDEASLAQGAQILLRAQQAVGGADKLAAVKDYTEVEEFLLTSGSGDMKVLQTNRWIAPTTFRQDSMMPNGRISAYSDGRAGWVSTPQGFGGLGGTQLKQVQGDLFRLYFRLLLSDRIAGRTVNALDSATIEVSDPAGQTATLECDAGTGLPRRMRYDLTQTSGAALKVTEEFDDFRDVGGVKIPYKIAISRGGQKFADVTVTDYKVNAGLQIRELAKRP
jgi:zinc protease